ncbi:MAG: M1 family aminopeptidase, partial [Planctomycetota bacterium]
MPMSVCRVRPRVLLPFFVTAFLTALIPLAGGCTTPPMLVRATAYDIRVNLDPASNHLEGQTALQLTRVADTPRLRGPVVVAFELNPALNITAVDCDSAGVRAHTTEPKKIEDPEDHEGPIPTIHRITLDQARAEFTMTVNYEGTLYQDPSAGEKRGEIHNFAMSAHVGTNGIYLSDSGGWYPTPTLPEETAPENALAAYRLVVDQLPGIELLAGLEPAPTHDEDGAHTWVSARPLAGIALTGGRRVRLTAEHAGTRIHALVSPGKEAIGEDLLDCARQCYDRYIPLVGPYPFREFSILESFFSSGFAFPGFTQLTPVILNDKKPYWRHGYLDHEFLHNWFGNGVYVDPHDGNWCEALTSYCANLFGYELDGDAAGARRQRRNNSHFLSRLKPEKDKPLGTFGLKEGAERGIGYDKGCMVFHMLACKIGPDAFWAGIRRLTTERMGKFINWDDLKACFQAGTKEDLDPFFEQWVRTAGAPQLAIRSATYDSAAGALELTVTQGETEFALDVPIRIYQSEQSYQDVLVRVRAPEEVVRLPVAAPVLVELDPDYHVFRKVPPEQMLPTSSLTRYGKKLVILRPDGEVWKNYDLVASDFEGGNKSENTTRLAVAEVTADALRDTGVLVLGAAVKHPVIRELLARAGCPVSWDEAGFRVGDQTYDRPGQAVLVTVRHPDDPKWGIT